MFLNDGTEFTCLTQGSSNTHWRLNGTDYNDLPRELQDDIYIDTVGTLNSQLIEMTFPARAEYNGTRVQCVAESDDGHSVVSDTATLTIQGIRINLQV